MRGGAPHTHISGGLCEKGAVANQQSAVLDAVARTLGTLITPYTFLAQASVNARVVNGDQGATQTTGAEEAHDKAQDYPGSLEISPGT